MSHLGIRILRVSTRSSSFSRDAWLGHGSSPEGGDITQSRLNKQVARTRRWILDALLELLAHTPYDDIRIGALAEAAGVSRQSFYRNFGTKGDVVAAYFDGVFDEFVQAARRGGPTDDPAVAYTVLFRTLRSHADELCRFAQPSSRHVLHDALWGYQERLLPFLPQDGRQGPEQVQRNEYLMKYQYGGIAALTVEWIEQGMVADPEVLGRIVAGITEPFRDQGAFLPALLQQLEASGQPDEETDAPVRRATR